MSHDFTEISGANQKILNCSRDSVGNDLCRCWIARKWTHSSLLLQEAAFLLELTQARHYQYDLDILLKWCTSYPSVSIASPSAPPVNLAELMADLLGILWKLVLFTKEL